MKRQATIRDVAKRAGVSAASVSYVLNDVNKVAPETKSRILAAMEELEYHPSHTARCLSTGESKLIGVSLPITEIGDDPGALLGHNPFFAEFIAGIESTVCAEGYDLLLCGVNSDEQYRDWIKSRKLDGLVMLGVYHRDIYEEVRQMDIPVVLADTYEEYASGFSRVMTDDRHAGYLAARHLIGLGHRRIAFVSGCVSKSLVNLRRCEGYRQALAEAGIAAEPGWLIEEHVSMEGGCRAAEQMLRTGRTATAACVMADIMAVGFIRKMSESGVKIPGDFSVVGFDNIEISGFLTPGLTTVDQDISLKGRTAAELILRSLGKRAEKSACATIPVRLLARGTTAPPAGEP